MEMLYYFGLTSVVSSIAWVIRTKIKEVEKRKRLKNFMKMDNTKIEAIGNYEGKAKNLN